MTRILLVVGWLLVVVDLITASTLFFGRKTGDAATSALGPGLGALLVALGVVAAALLIWAGRGEGRTLAMIIASVIAGAPTILAIGLTVSPRSILGVIYPSMRERPREMMPSAQYAFPDSAGRAAALAIVMGDYAKLDTILHETPPPDLTARDELGHSLLGLAAASALAGGSSPRELEGLRLIIAAGGRPRLDDMGPGELPMIEAAAGVQSPNGGPVLKMLLDAGLPAQTPMSDGRSLLFYDYLSPAAAGLLVAHGANPGVHEGHGEAGEWSPVTYHVDRQHWETALALLNAGVPRDHGTPVGKVLQRVIRVGEAQISDADRNNAAYQALMAIAR